MSIATLTATGGTGGPYTWSIIGGADAQWFTLTSGGVLSFTSPKDFESPIDANHDNIYVVQVKVTDGTLSGTQIISVQVTNVVEPPTITSSASYSVAENTTAVATMTASGGGGAPYTWTISGGADVAKFTITPDGILTFATAPDREAPTDADGNNIYVVNVEVTDASAVTATKTVAVTVTNVLDAPPVITAPASFSVAENTTSVTTLTATADAGATLTWTIIGGADAAAFTLSTGGILSFATAPDYELPTDADGNNVYALQVQVTDGTTAVSQTLAITVTNVVEVVISPTAFISPEDSLSIAVLTASGGSGAYTWTKTGGGADAAKFNLTSAGALSFVTAPDYEAPTDADVNNVYVVDVQAANASGTASATLSVTVTNVDDPAVFATTLSASRAGIGSAVVAEDHTGKTRII